MVNNNYKYALMKQLLPITFSVFEQQFMNCQ